MELITTFSVVFHSTTLAEDNASAYSQPGKVALNGNSQGLNGLGLGDDFSRNSGPGRRRQAFSEGDWLKEIHCGVTPGGLTSVKAGLKYREIPREWIHQCI
jgi:hypothetical protein